MRIAKFSIGYIEELANFIIKSLDPIIQERIVFADFSIYQSTAYLQFSFEPSVADSPFLRCKHSFKPYKAYTVKTPKTCKGMPTDADWNIVHIPETYDSHVNDQGFIGLARLHQKKFFPEINYQVTFDFDDDEDMTIDEDRLRDIRLDLDDYVRLNLMSMAHIEVTQKDE